jgi:ribosome silencing factor RsfS/YbeB/iojap
MKTDEIETLVRAKESPRRYAHTRSVVEMAVDLARRYGADEDKARTAALFHDLCKDGTKPGNDLSHAGEAADLMRSEYGVDDEDVLNAVRYHTTGRVRMSKLELIVFLADKLEPTRNYGGVSRLRGLAYDDLYRGALEALKELHEYLARNGVEPARDSLDAIEWLEGETENMPKETKEPKEAKETLGTDGDRIMKMVIRARTDAGEGNEAGVRAGGETGVRAGQVLADVEKSLALAREIAEAIDAKKGRDIAILDISAQSSFADCFVNATATNIRMLASLRDEVDDVLTKRGLELRGAEGRPESGWILADCGDVIVNLFLEEQREKYQLEKIWGDAVRAL